LDTQLRRKRLVSNIFTFVDASKLISKTALWEERDRAMEKGLEKFNNKTAKRIAHDPQAQIGCKGPV